MKSYAQFCPVAKAAEVLGERWSILILRDMLCGSRRFNDLARGLPGISRPLLAKRLRGLESAGLVRKAPDGYDLTPAGEELRNVVFGLAQWGARWAFTDPTPDELDPDLLLWWMHSRIDHSNTPDRVVVVQFEFTDRKRWYWLVIEPTEVSVCRTDPGFAVDVVVRTDLVTMHNVWLGRTELLDAVRAGTITLLGAPSLVRAFPSWFRLSPVSEYVRAAVHSAAAD